MASTSSFQRNSARELGIASLLGGYAALIALSPRIEISLALTAALVACPFAVWVIAHPTRWITAFFIAALLLPPLPIALGDSGPHVCLVVAALGLLSGILRLSDWHFEFKALNVALIGFFAVLLASVGLAAFYAGPSVAAGSFTRVLLFGISVYLFAYAAYGPGRLWVLLLYGR